MEKRVLTLELLVEQNTKLVERLDRSMSQLSQAVVDLRCQMMQGHADLRLEIATSQAELRKEIAASHAELHRFFERKFIWLFTAYCGGLLTVVGFLGKYLIDVYVK